MLCGFCIYSYSHILKAVLEASVNCFQTAAYIYLADSSVYPSTSGCFIVCSCKDPKDPTKFEKLGLFLCTITGFYREVYLGEKYLIFMSGVEGDALACGSCRDSSHIKTNGKCCYISRRIVA